MYQSHVYLEVRILLPTAPEVFGITENPVSYSVNPVVLQHVAALSRALGCTWNEDARFEHITGTLSVPPEYHLSGLSVCIAGNGSLTIEFHRRQKKILIEELRIEEDAGRLTRSDGKTRMDYTHAGMASVRIRTSDDFELGEEAYLFLDELRRLLQYLGLCGDMPADALIRCNAHVALAKYPDMPDYYVKLRNLNSFNFVRKAVNSELSRQEEILVSGGVVASESRLWNERQNITESYKTRLTVNSRFAPVEKAAPFHPGSPVPAEYADSCTPVELPGARRDRLCSQYGLARTRSELICDEKSRADFYEAAVAAGADSMDAAHWISSELPRILKRCGVVSGFGKLTAESFASVIRMFSANTVNSGMAKQILQSVIETGSNPEVLMKQKGWSQISGEKELLPYIRQVISENPAETEKLSVGEMAPLEFLTGIVMKMTKGMADPLAVKTLLKKELNISVVYVLSFGGAICGKHREDGSVAPADEKTLETLLAESSSDIKYQVVPLGHMLSEEIEPGDWASLITEIAARMTAGTANGIVVAHGTDTLPYTAALLYWLFSDADVPVVLTASSTTPDMSDEAAGNLKLAVETACQKKSGVYVAFGGKLLSPLNLKFMKPTPDGFTNWNLQKPVFTRSGPLAFQFSGVTDLDSFVLKQILRETADSMLVCRVYPGLRSESYASLIDEGITRFFLELYETGTGNMRGSDYSLKQLLVRGKKKDCRFYCTSQQESCLNFADYATSRRMWREGAVPMGRLTTESAVALYFAASLASDTCEELDQFMETYAELYS